LVVFDVEHREEGGKEWITEADGVVFGSRVELGYVEVTIVAAVILSISQEALDRDRVGHATYCDVQGKVICNHCVAIGALPVAVGISLGSPR